jgi:hypothetical protein
MLSTKVGMVLLLGMASAPDTCDPQNTTPKQPPRVPSCIWETNNRYESTQEKPVEASHMSPPAKISLNYERNCLKVAVKRKEGDCTMYWVDQNKGGTGDRTKDFSTGKSVEQTQINEEPGKEWYIAKGDYYIHFAPSPCVSGKTTGTKAIVSVTAGNWKEQ